MAIIVTCTCGKQFKVKEELAGKRGKCAACGRVLSVPTLAPSVDPETPSPSPLRACPTCRVDLQPNAVICLNCGHDLRTGKQVPQSKFSVPVAPSRPSANVPASSARRSISLIAGGTCLAGVAAGVTATLLFWGRGSGIPAIAPQPNRETQNVSSAANALPNKAAAASPTGGVVQTPLAGKQLSAVAQKAVQYLVNVVVYTEVFAATRGNSNLDPSFALMGRNDLIERAAADVVKFKCEREAVVALLKVISEKRSSRELLEQTACANAVRALGYFGPEAKDAAPMLVELIKHHDMLVVGDATESLKKIQFGGTDTVVANKEGADSKVTTDLTNDSPVLKKLLAEVTAISLDDVVRYEKFLSDRTFLNAMAYQGALGDAGDEVRDVINLGLEKSAVSTLIKLIQQKSRSTDKADLLICRQSIRALGHFGPLAREATQLLDDLQNSQDNAVGSAAKLALKDINGKPQPLVTANPLAQAASLPKEPRPARIVRQAQALPKSGPDEWLAALETATGTAESSTDVFLFLTDFNRLYDKTSFRDDESAKLINRMKIVPKAEIDIWNEALTKSVGGRLISCFSNDSAALVVIIQQDLLFKEQEVDRAMSQILCQRLATIPNSAVEEVTGIGNQNSAMQNTDAALAIAKYDPLFVGNQFQPNVWAALKR